MDLGALPPEVNSGRMYLGPGPATLLAASAGWERLAAELHAAASGYQSVISRLTDDSWEGPSSMSMEAAITPYLMWMRATAAQCEEAARQATAAAAAYETAFAMTVPPPMIVANRAALMTLIAANSLSQHTPAIMATEAEYSEMWAQDATAMYNYAANSASASAFTTFTSPPQTTNPGGLAGQAGVSAQVVGTGAATKTQATSASALSSLAASTGSGLNADTLGLGTDVGGLGFDTVGPGLDFEGADSTVGGEGAPGLADISGLGGLGLFHPSAGVDIGASATFGDATSLGALSVPLSWVDALALPAPEPVLDANVMPGGWGAKPWPTSGAGVSKSPLGGMIGRESGRAVARVGFRSSLILRSPVAG
jgi:PPE-repeat protein